jgi:hypothetical protein
MAPTNCYPTVIDSQSCPTSGGYIYCVGAFDSASVSTNEVCYAQLGTSSSTASAASQTPTCFALSTSVTSTTTTTTSTTGAATQGASISPLYLGLVAIAIIALLALFLIARRRRKKPEATDQKAGVQWRETGPQLFVSKSSTGRMIWTDAHNQASAAARLAALFRGSLLERRCDSRPMVIPSYEGLT